MPVTSLPADLAYILSDVGVVVVHGGVTTTGKFRRAPVDVMTNTGIEKVATHATLIVADGVLTAPDVDDPIVIGGVNYVVRDVDEPMPDGTVRMTVVPQV